MAIVVLAGLVTSGVLDLLLMPVLFFNLGVSSVRDLDPVLETTPGPVFAPMPAPSGAAGD
jgi:hypothetical protein